MIEVTSEELIFIIGTQSVEIAKLRQELVEAAKKQEPPGKEEKS